MKKHNFRIKEARERKGLTQAELAAKLGVAQNTFCGYESGDHDPKSNKLAIIARECDTTIDYLLRLTDDPRQAIEIEKSPEPESSEEQISMDQSNRLFDALMAAGLIDDSGEFTEADRAFFRSIVSLIDAWAMSKRI